MTRTLEDMCQYCKNYFPRQCIEDTFVIEDGELQSVTIPTNTYYIIFGSIYNDGLHRDSDTLTDETFEGCITLCAIPNSFIDLATTINTWRTTNEATGSIIRSPFSSESFNGYSYSKEVGNSGWRAVFKDELGRWRKI